MGDIQVRTGRLVIQDGLTLDRASPSDSGVRSGHVLGDVVRSEDEGIDDG